MYVDLAGLARYKSDFGAWARGAFLPKNAAAARVRTAKAGAVSFVPVQRTPLDVSVDFLFSETGPASGDKGPDNPSTITGVSSVKVTRANSNLIRWPYYDSSGRESGGVTWTVNADGSISASGTTTSFSTFRLQLTDRYPTEAMLVPRGSYRYSGCPSGGGGNAYRLDVAIYTPHASRATKTSDYGNGGTLVVTEPALCSFYCAINTGQTVSNLQFKPKLQLDGVDEPFEKNEQDVYTIPLGNTYYGGTLDVASGVMTVTKEFVTLNTVNASDGIAGGNAIFRAWPESLGMLKPINDGTEICEELPRATSGSGVNRFFVGAPVNGNCPIYVILNPNLLDLSGAADPSNPTPSEVRTAGIAYLNAHPLHMVLSLEAPYTVQLTPTEILSLTQSSDYDPRVNTVYGDAQAVQVGYLKHPSAASSDLRNAVVSLGGGV